MGKNNFDLVPKWLRIVVGLLALANIGFGVSGYLDISVLFHDGNGLDLSNTLIKTVSNEFAARNLGIGLGLLIVSLKGVPESIAIMTIVRALIEIQTIILNLLSSNMKGVFMAGPFLVLELFVIVSIIQIIKKRNSALSASVDQMNSLPPGTCGDKKYELNVKQSIFKKPCALFNIKAGELIKDHDLIYLYGYNNLLFMGAKHVDGKGFYTEDLRPKGGLQIPLIKSKD